MEGLYSSPFHVMSLCLQMQRTEKMITLHGEMWHFDVTDYDSSVTTQKKHQIKVTLKGLLLGLFDFKVILVYRHTSLWVCWRLCSDAALSSRFQSGPPMPSLLHSLLVLSTTQGWQYSRLSQLTLLLAINLIISS